MKNKILYIHVGLSSFVKKDIKILSSEFDVIENYFDVSVKKKIPLIFIKQLFFLVQNIFNSTAIIIQFSGFHSFLPVILGKLFKKKTIIILGGTDCVSFPSINYGNFNRKLLSFFTKKSIEYASLVLPVSKELIYSKYSYQQNDFEFQGYKYFCPNINTPSKVIYNGFDPNQWKSSAYKEKNSFVTVAANLGSSFGIELKGIDLILKAAEILKDCKFYIVGGKTIKRNINIPRNVILVDLIPNDELSYFLGSKEFYLQLSMSEGFPNSLCEAMLCENIPIVSNVSCMPYIIGNNGSVLNQKDINELVEILKLNIKISNKKELGFKARLRVIENFSLDNRKEKLLIEIKNILD
jgi:hypothetical protein